MLIVIGTLGAKNQTSHKTTENLRVRQDLTKLTPKNSTTGISSHPVKIHQRFLNLRRRLELQGLKNTDPRQLVDMELKTNNINNNDNNNINNFHNDDKNTNNNNNNYNYNKKL